MPRRPREMGKDQRTFQGKEIAPNYEDRLGMAGINIYIYYNIRIYIYMTLYDSMALYTI